MKSVKFLVFALALLVGASASAQVVSNRDENGKMIYGPYMTNKVGDNWFIGVAGGFNVFNDKNNGFGSRFSPALDVNFGKWFNPVVGGRLGYQGITGSEDNTNDKTIEKFGFAYLHGDALFNISHLFCGYRSDRFWNFVPYLHAGYLRLYNVTDEKNAFSGMRTNAFDNEFSAGAGLLNLIRISNRVNITLDARMFLFSGRFHNWFNGGPARNLSLTAGVQVNLGKKVTWDRCPADLSGDLAAAKDALAAARAALDAANADNDALRKALANIKPTVDTVFVGKQIDAPVTLFFEIGKSTLKPTELAHLDYYVKNILSQDEKCVFYLTGSADKGTGNDKINERLGRERVATLTKILVEKYGISPDRLVFKEAKISTDNPKEPTLDRSVKLSK